MPSVQLTAVSFAWGDAPPVLTDVSLLLGPGWHGLVGENGAGKSTLLGLLSGALRPPSGARKVTGRVVSCPQVVESCDAAIHALAERDDGPARRVRGRLGLEPWRLDEWEKLSGGERKRWQIGAALVDDPDVLLLDEPTNHIDAEARAWLLAALRGYRGVGVLVSHDRALLDALTTATIRVHRGAVTTHPGPYSAARADWERAAAARRDGIRAAQTDARAADRRLQSAREEHAAADAARSTRGRMKDKNDHDGRSMGRKTQAAWAEDRAGRTVGARRTEAERAAAAVGDWEAEAELGRSVFFGWIPSPRPVLTSFTGDLSVGGVPLLRGVDLAVRRTDRLRLAGPNGIGKTTLLAALRTPDLLYLPQELTAADAAADLAQLRALPSLERGRVLQLVAALGADPPRLLATASPSPGEARKLRIALGLGTHVAGCLLDEPTNHLDLPSVERLSAALAAWPGALVLVTHDDALATAARTEAVEVAAWRVGGSSGPPSGGSHDGAGRPP